ncbi:hypothetical protein LOK49_LG05G00566 [Camellia lanceoleosa]|uniref:Uncharacterized protein n=1 Tax=Camellia lanceoleosa TaxID=1840588 RepID=A0ACC0HPP7_9ERIC|nr:hypothetical protein LOK49_LG05G00566 [Camellia lanceoleosa]
MAYGPCLGVTIPWLLARKIWTFVVVGTNFVCGLWTCLLWSLDLPVVVFGPACCGL